MNGGGASSPMGFGSRRPFSSASPSGSNNTNTGRPPLWTSSSQRKVSRLYLYTTLPLQKIIEVVHSKSPDTAPGKESANKKLNNLLDKEPRWLHPRTESDMGRRLNELALSPTRSLSTRSSETPPSHPGPEPVLLNPNPTPAMKREAGTSPTTLEVPPFHQFPHPTYNAPAQMPTPSPYGQRQPRPPMDHESHGPLSGFLRRTTFMSSSTQGTTGFKEGDWVYLRLQPYRQSTVAWRRNMKLAPRYYGPFRVIKKIGSVAYHLDLPEGTRIHRVFHVSLLKKKLGDKVVPQESLPSVGPEGEIRIEPMAILDRRMVNRNNKAVTQYIGQTPLPKMRLGKHGLTSKTVFQISNLEDKVVLDGAEN